MKRNKQAALSGGLLDKPSVTLPQVTPLSSFLFFFVLQLLAALGVMGSFYTAFAIPIGVFPVVLSGLLCTLVCTGQYFLPRRGWVLGLAAAVLWGLLLWSNFTDLIQASIRTVNAVSFAYSERLSFTLPYFITDTIFADRLNYLYTLFAAFLQFPFSLVLALLLIRWKSCLGAFLFTGIFLALPLSFSILPAGWALGFILLFWVFLLLSASTLRQRQLLQENKNGFFASGSGFSRVSALVILPAIALCMALIWLIRPAGEYVRPPVVNEVRTSIVQALRLPNIFSDGTGSDNQRIDLSTLGDRRYDGSTALRVKRTWKNGRSPALSSSISFAKKEYLKSFVGSVYTGQSWERLSLRDAMEASSLLGDQKAQHLPADFSQYMSSLSSSDFPHYFPYELSIQNLGTNRRCVFSPYGLWEADLLSSDVITYVDDSFVECNKLFGTDQYTFQTDSLPAKAGQLSYNSRFWLYFDPIFKFWNTLSANNPTDNLSDTAIKRLADLDELRELLEDRTPGREGVSGDLWQAPALAKEYCSDEAKELADAVEKYSAFVYDHYTRLPDDTRAFVDQYCRENGLTLKTVEFGPNNTLFTSSDRIGEDQVLMMNQSSMVVLSLAYLERQYKQDYIEAVRKHLTKKLEYNASPPSLPAGRDFVEFFLSESKEGYCVHFATAAVALFRAAGIPARYAEGYVAPTSKEDVWVEVPDQNAHAWVEVWFGGVGWMPVEVTPAGPDSPAAYDDATVPVFTGTAPNGGSAPFSPTDGLEFTPPPSAATVIASPSPGDSSPAQQETAFEKQVARWIPWVALLGAVLLAALILFVSRPVRLFLRKKKFRQADRNKAALCVYSHIVKLHRQCAVVVIHVSVDPPEELEALALKARYSTHMLTGEELDQLIEYAHSVEHKIKLHFTTPHRLYCKYVLALF